MDYEKLKEVIAKQIKENGRREITGPVLQAVLMAMVDSLGEVYPHTYTEEQKAQARANIDALSDHNGAINKEKLSAEVQAILDDVANKQNITDESLATIAKTIVGAINEVYKGGLKDASIATSKIEDGAITDAKIVGGAVTTPKIANDAVTTEKVNDGAITEPKLDTDLANVITSAVQPAELASAIATALASYVAKADIVAITGSATDKVMSQHGVTEAINGVTNKVTELDINTNTQIVYVGNEQSSLVVGDVWFYDYVKTLYKKTSTGNKEMPSNILCSYNGSRYLYIKGLPLIDLNVSGVRTLLEEIKYQTNSDLVYVGITPTSVNIGEVWFYTDTKTLYKKVSSTSNEELASGTIVKYNGSRYLYIKGKDLVNLDYTTQVNPSPGIELSNGKNKYNWRTCVDGFLQRNNVVNTGYVGYATSEVISIKKNTDYTISHTQSYEIYDGNMNSIAYRVGNGADNNYTFNSGNAVFIRVSTNLGYYQRTQIEEGTEVTSFEEYVVPRIIGGNCLSSHMSLFAGKKYLSLGDSLTERGQYQAELSYNVGGFAEINNKGVYGRVIKDWIYERNGTDLIPADTLNQYDLITFGGIANDYNNSTPIGTINDATTENTFYGSAKKVCEYLLTCCPDKMIIGFSVPQFNYTRGWGAVNEVGATMWDYNDAMRKVCERYAIPFVDIMNNSGICELNKSLYYTVSDTVHPNQRGMKRMADIIASVIVPMQNRLDKIFVG